MKITMKTSLPNASTFLILLLLLLPVLTCTGSDSQRRVQSETSSCFRSTDPDITAVDHVFDDNDRNLWSKEGELRPCSSVSKPPPSRCAVCRDWFIHVVCCQLPQNVTLDMGGGGRLIHIVESECPQLQGEGSQRNAATGNHSGRLHWWFPVFISFILISITAG